MVCSRYHALRGNAAINAPAFKTTMLVQQDMADTGMRDATLVR